MTRKSAKLDSLRAHRYRLRRDSDDFGVGHGFILRPLRKNAVWLNTEAFIGRPGEIRVGHRIYCGNFTRYIVTSPVVQIMACNKERTRIQFKTQNSYYTASISVMSENENPEDN